jgi:hypothetical protein
MRGIPASPAGVQAKPFQRHHELELRAGKSGGGPGTPARPVRVAGNVGDSLRNGRLRRIPQLMELESGCSCGHGCRIRLQMPNTGFNVQGFITDEDPVAAGYHPVTCLACTRLNLVDPNTSKVAAASERKS